MQIPDRIPKSIERMLQVGRAGKLGARGGFSCAYHDENGCFCSIGAVLSPSTHALIDKHGLNSGSGPEQIAELIGVDRFKHETGLTTAEARQIQNLHDRAFNRDQGYTYDEKLEMFTRNLESWLDGTLLEWSIKPLQEILAEAEAALDTATG